MAHLYATLAEHIASSIDKGLYQPGERLPGVRAASTHEGVSPATVVSAYRQLELDGYIEARPRSGFFVRPRLQTRLAEPGLTKPSPRPKPVTGQELVLQLIQHVNDKRITQLGASIPDASFLPSRAVSQAVSAVANQSHNWNSTYEVPPGLPELRLQIAKRMSANGCITDPDHIIVTSGCQEALYLSLKSVTQPGDVVAIESPTYYGLLQAIDTLGLKALEIPTDPQHGLSVDALQLALEQWPIKACVLVPNFNNPVGSLMPQERKQALMDLIDKHKEVVLIEDDIYGELNFEGRRPSVMKTLDTRGNVIYCSSFSKTLSPALRIGWIVSESFKQRIEYEKFVTNCATSTVSQLATARLLANGHYDRHLRNLRVALARNVARISERVCQYFPAGTKLSRPAGGMSLWLQVPGKVDATALSQQALDENISIAPGAMFSSSPNKYKDCMRLNCAIAWSDEVERAIATLGRLAAESRSA